MGTVGETPGERGAGGGGGGCAGAASVEAGALPLWAAELTAGLVPPLEELAAGPEDAA